MNNETDNMLFASDSDLIRENCYVILRYALYQSFANYVTVTL